MIEEIKRRERIERIDKPRHRIEKTEADQNLIKRGKKKGFSRIQRAGVEERVIINDVN